LCQENDTAGDRTPIAQSAFRQYIDGYPAMTLDIFIQPFVQWTWKTRDNIVQDRLNVSTHLKLRGSILLQTAVPSSHGVRKRVKWLHAIVYPGTEIAQAVS
jgi:hypothetical protein